MGCVRAGEPQVVEHYVLNPGDYRPLADLGEQPQIDILEGHESPDSTWLHFSLPCEGDGQFRHDLQPGQKLTVWLAYSSSDDFDHHSRIRLSISVHL